MPAAISDSLFERFSGFLASRMGLAFPRGRWADMQRGVERAAREFGCADAEDCMRRLLASVPGRCEVEILASQLTVGETYFYREPAVFAALENAILPALIAARRAAGQLSLRLWSAGCCTGEEPYTLAILLARLLPDIEQWNIMLLATDINPGFLTQARRGEYREWSFRGTPEWFREGYFERAGPGRYVLTPRIRRLVGFDYLNLVDDVYPALTSNTNGLDLVLCRNVLMYFEPDVACAVTDKFRRALVDGGWLIVSPTEANPRLLAGFVAAGIADAAFYRKGGPPAAPAVMPAAPSWGEIVVPEASVAPPAGRVPEASVAPPTGRMPEASVAPPAGRVPDEPPAVAAAPAVPVAPDAGAAHEAALARYARGEYMEAVAALAATPQRDAASLALAARACANLGRLDEAGRWCEAAVAADKFDPGLRYLLASILTEEGNAEAAAAALRQALYLDRDFALAHFALGNLYRRQGQPAPAARHFANARELLAARAPASLLPAGEGLTAGRLLEILDSKKSLA